MGTYDTQGSRLSETIYYPGTPTPIARIDQKGEIIYLHSDHLGTPRLATDTSQTVVWRWVSDAFGTTDPDGDGVSTIIDHRFPGQYFDEETGLHYNWHRYYDPSTGRYITSDPIGLNGGMNTYSYALQNPLGNTDPMGLSAVINVLPFAGGAAVSDGPLPVGDAIALILLSGAAFYDITFGSDNIQFSFADAQSMGSDSLILHNMRFRLLFTP